MNKLLGLIFKLIQASWLYYLAQILVTSSMWRSGIDKLVHFDAAIAEMAGDGLNPPVFFAGLTVFVQLVGSLLAVFGRRWAWLGSGALAVFTVMTILLIHNFWAYSGAEYTAHFKTFQSHLILIGGLTLSVIASVAKYHSETLCDSLKKI